MHGVMHGFLNRRSRASEQQIALRDAHRGALARPRDALTSTDACASGA
jgi:hypothetical protein